MAQFEHNENSSVRGRYPLDLGRSIIEKVHHHKHRPIHEHSRPISIFIQARRLLFPVLVMLGLLVIGTGATTLWRGRLGYYNYQHLPVFAPFAIVVGLIFLVWTFAMWKKFKAAESARRTIRSGLASELKLNRFH